MELKEIEKIVKEKLSEKRFYHSKCTMMQCEKLAKLYGEDVEKARTIGIAHDIAKELSKEEKLEYVHKNGIEINEVEEYNVGLLHAKIGADICKKEFGFTDDMVQAVSSHTTAKSNMSMLAKILFVADGIGDDRNWDDLEYARELANKNIDDAVLYMIDLLIKDRIAENKALQLDSVIARNEIILKKEK